MKEKEHKIDKLFKEKLSNMEIPLEEDYWPLIEKNINPSSSFYRFGWKHFNIYSSSFILLLALIGALFLIDKPEKKETEKTTTPFIENNGLPKDKDSSDTEKSSLPNENNSFFKLNKQNKKNLPVGPSPEAVNDSVTLPEKENIITPPVIIEPSETNTQKLQPKKKAIYVVQQDTIIEKDTVKVRRKKRK